MSTGNSWILYVKTFLTLETILVTFLKSELPQRSRLNSPTMMYIKVFLLKRHRWDDQQWPSNTERVRQQWRFQRRRSRAACQSGPVIMWFNRQIKNPTAGKDLLKLPFKAATPPQWDCESSRVATKLLTIQWDALALTSLESNCIDLFSGLDETLKSVSSVVGISLFQWRSRLAPLHRRPQQHQCCT